MKLIVETTNQLLAALEEVEEPFSADIEDTAVSVTRCIKNVIWSASCTIQGNRASEKILKTNSCFRHKKAKSGLTYRIMYGLAKQSIPLLSDPFSSYILASLTLHYITI